ncbi:MAG: cytochrome c [Deltaproteobacteria bacterium]|nr:MAG: cytochrome c [Deltaproteobacteria bacterium]
MNTIEFFIKKFLIFFFLIFFFLVIFSGVFGRGFISRHAPILLQQNMFIQEKVVPYTQVYNKHFLKNSHLNRNFPIELFEDEIPISDENWLSTGLVTYKNNCQICHGKAGSGFPLNFDLQITPPPLLDLQSLKEVDIFKKIKHHKYGVMPSFKNQLQAREAWAVAYYIKNEHLQKEISSILNELKTKGLFYNDLLQTPNNYFEKLFFFNLLYDCVFYNEYFTDSFLLNVSNLAYAILDPNFELSFESFYEMLSQEEITDEDLNFILLRIKEKLIRERQIYDMFSNHVGNPYFGKVNNLFITTEFNREIYNNLLTKLLFLRFSEEHNNAKVDKITMCTIKSENLGNKLYGSENLLNKYLHSRLKSKGDKLFVALNQSLFFLNNKVAELENSINGLKRELEDDKYILVEKCPLIYKDFFINIYNSQLKDLTSKINNQNDDSKARKIMLEIDKVKETIETRKTQIETGQVYDMFYNVEMSYEDFGLILLKKIISYETLVKKYNISLANKKNFFDLDFLNVGLIHDIDKKNLDLIIEKRQDVEMISLNREMLDYQLFIQELQQEFEEILRDIDDLKGILDKIRTKGAKIHTINTSFLQKDYMQLYMLKNKLNDLQCLLIYKKDLNEVEMLGLQGSFFAFDWYLEDIKPSILDQNKEEKMLMRKYRELLEKLKYKKILLGISIQEREVRAKYSQDSMSKLIQLCAMLLTELKKDQEKVRSYLEYISESDVKITYDFMGHLTKSCMIKAGF